MGMSACRCLQPLHRKDLSPQPALLRRVLWVTGLLAFDRWSGSRAASS